MSWDRQNCQSSDVSRGPVTEMEPIGSELRFVLLHIIETVETSKEPRIRKAESAFDNMALFASVALSWLARQDNGFEINSASWTCLDIRWLVLSCARPTQINP